MKIIKLIAMLALPGMACAQTNSNLPDFTGIEMDAPYNIELIQSSTNKIECAGKPEFKVEKNILHIEPGADDPSAQAIKIYFTNLASVEVNGPGEIRTAQGSTIKGEAFRLESNGASKTDLGLEVKMLRVESNGAAKITLHGSADEARVELSGAAKLYAADLKTKDMKIAGAGATYFSVYASNNLQVDASGAVKGMYAGNPATKNINVDGISHIVDANTGEQMTDERITGKTDTTRLSIGNRKVIIIDDGDDVKTKKEDKELDEEKRSGKTKRRELKHVFAGFELGVNTLAAPNLNFNLPASASFLACETGRSWFYGLNLFEKDAQIIRNKLAITSGFGMEFQHFEFATDNVLQANKPVVSASPVYTSDSTLMKYTTNRLYNFNLNVPLLVKFAPRTRKHRNGFHIAAGLIGTYKAYSHLKLETSSRGFEEETIMRDNFNINPFRVAATVRVGYGWFRAFANYSLTPYFKQTNGNPDVRVFAAGITLIPFQ